MGIEPTQDPLEPNTGFEDQGHHQAPVTSEEWPFDIRSIITDRHGFELARPADRIGKNSIEDDLIYR